MKDNTNPTNGVPANGDADVVEKKIENTDAIEEAIGGMGKFQLIICALIFLSKFPVAFHQLGIIFLAPPVSFVCLDDNKNISMGCPCDEVEYDRTVFEETIIMSFGLICEKGWLKDFSQSVFMFGILLGSIGFGYLSDKYGRRIPLVVAVVLQLLSGIAASFAPEYWSFTFLRFVLGIATGGTMVAGYVLIMEVVGKRYREPVSSLYQLPFNVGHLMLAGFGYWLRSWSTLQLALTIPSVLLLIYYWVLPESPRWLLAIGETDKAIKILEKGAKSNNLPTEKIAGNITEYQNAKSKEQMHKGSIIELFRTPNLRRNTICMTINWLVCGFGYYGVSQYIGTLAGNMFVNVAISATITIPGTLGSIPMMRIMGRRTLVMGTLILTSVCLFAIALLPKDGNPTWQVTLACIGDVGMFVAFITVYLYASELFPTVVRNVGIGLCSMMARVGSMLAPYVVELGTTTWWLPPLIFGVASLISAGLCLLMPETKGCELTNTIEEAEEFGRINKRK